ncbi:MAG TPA: RagB/SusD family nutrient uptake outer membrane protein [Puia sp.]
MKTAKLRKPRIILYGFLFCIAAFSCKKSAFLDANPDQSQIVPTTVADCQELLDNDVVMNGYGNSGYPSLGETGCDDYTVSAAQYTGYTAADQHAVVWASGIYNGQTVSDWDLPYRVIFYSNEVLDVLSGITPPSSPSADWNQAKGIALFYRGYALYELAQLFAPPYDSSRAGTDWGLPLRMSADVNEKIYRATVKDTYTRILDDLGTSVPLLLENPGWDPNRPARAAAYGILSRVCLSMRNYTQAGLYADSCLQIRHALMDYNTIDSTVVFPFSRINPEVIFSIARFRTGPSAIARSYADSVLFNSYQANDLRKKLFFRSGPLFFGRYDSSAYAFGGLATDELWLTRAECSARAGQTAAAMNDLNTLLQTRLRTGTFTPVVATDAGDALLKVLTERRKELLYRGLRWTDLRRLNKEPQLAITLHRTVNGEVYTLPPNDARYVYAIPDNVISQHPEMPQNIR